MLLVTDQILEPRPCPKKKIKMVIVALEQFPGVGETTLGKKEALGTIPPLFRFTTRFRVTG